MGERNDEGQAVVDFAKRMELVISNTLFQKKLGHKITYSSGGRNTQVDLHLAKKKKAEGVLRHEGDYWRKCGETAQVSSQQVDYVDKVEKRS